MLVCVMGTNLLGWIFNLSLCQRSVCSITKNDDRFVHEPVCWCLGDSWTNRPNENGYFGDALDSISIRSNGNFPQKYLENAVLFLFCDCQVLRSLRFSSWATFSLVTPGWNWQKIKQNLCNTPRLNFRYFKIIRFLHPRYHPKVIGDILKMYQKQVLLFRRCYMINDNENEAEKGKKIT